MLARVRRLPRAVREQQMLDAAVAVFSAVGFHAASMDEIAERAGISKPMVYAYLGAKEELFIACVHRAGTRLMESIVAAAAPGLPPDEQLWRGLQAFVAFVGGNREAWSVLYRQARGQERFAAEVAGMRMRMVEVVTGLLTGALTGSGRPAVEADAVPVAYALVGACESVADWIVDHPGEPPEVTATRLMNVVWLGAAEVLRGHSWRPGVSR